VRLSILYHVDLVGDRRGSKTYYIIVIRNRIFGFGERFRVYPFILGYFNPSYWIKLVCKSVPLI